MRKKLLIAIALLVSGVGNLWADDVFKELTGKLANPSFEANNGTVSDTPSSGTTSNDITGWTFTQNNGRVAVFNSSSEDDTYGKSSPSAGTYYVRIRTAGGSSSDPQTLISNSAFSIQKGTYRVSFDYKAGRVHNYTKNFTVSAMDGSTSLGSKQNSIPKATKSSTYFSETLWTTDYFTFSITESKDVKIKIVCEGSSSSAGRTVLALDNFKLEWNLTEALSSLISEATTLNETLSDSNLGTAISEASAVSSTDADVLELAYYKLAWNMSLASAKATRDAGTYTNVGGSERADLVAAIGASVTDESSWYSSQKTTLDDAVAAFTAARTNYDKYAEEKTRAIAMGVDDGDIPELTSSENYLTTLHDLIVLEDAAVTAGYTVNVGEFLGEWTKSNTTDVSDRHWSGTTKSYYYKYSDSNTTMSVYKTITLPAGTYVFKAAATFVKRNGDETKSYLGVKIGDDWIYEYYEEVKGYSGLGINTDGEASYNAEDTKGFANDNNGYGWQWRFVRFELGSDTEVQLKISTNISATGWVAFSDINLFTTADNINYYRQLYLDAKSAAEDAREDATYTNVHNGSEWVALNSAINEAVPSPATIKWYQDQKAALDAATAAFTNSTTVTNYNRLAAAIAEATLIGVDHSSYDVTSSTTEGTALTNANALYTSMFEGLKTDKAKKTLGFEKDEYAPYNNVDILAAWVKADAITTVADASTDVLDDAITSLNGASWSSANATEVNGVYDGTLKNAEIKQGESGDNVVLAGWVTKSGNTRQTFKGTEGASGKACLAGADDQVGLFVHPGTYNYGETDGYTMPLKSGVVYVARAKYCSWSDGSNNNFTLKILKNGNEFIKRDYGANTTACTVEDALKEVQLFFTPDADANYVLSVVVGGNTFMTDFYIEKATATAINENSDYTPTAGNAFVELTRNFNADAWNTLVLPFDMTLAEAKAVFGDGITIANYTGTTTLISGNDQLQFSTSSASIHANQPVLIYGASNVNAAKILNRVISEATPTLTPDGASYSFVGSYSASTTLAAGDYFIANDNKIYSVGATLPTMKGTRAYFHPVGGGVKAAGFTIDGNETGIMTLDGNNSQVLTGDIYTISGVRVSAPVKGLNIINGKKVFIK